MKIIKSIIIILIITAIGVSIIFIGFFEKKLPMSLGVDKKIMNYTYFYSFTNLNKSKDQNLHVDVMEYSVNNDEKSLQRKYRYSFEKTGTNETLCVKYKITEFNLDNSILKEDIYKYYREDTFYVILSNGTSTNVNESIWQSSISDAYNNVTPFTSDNHLISHISVEQNLEKISQKGMNVNLFSSLNNSSYISSVNLLSNKLTTISHTEKVFNEENNLNNIIEKTYHLNYTLKS